MQAMMVASSLALLSLIIPPVSIISAASVALVTLRRGRYEGLYVLIFTCLSVALLGFFIFGNFQPALLYGLILWLPVWLMSVVLREGKLSVAIEVAVILGIVVVIGFYAYVDEPSLIWMAIWEEQLVNIANTEVETPMPVAQIRESIQIFSHYMTGGVVAGTVCILVFSLFLARMWQSALYNPGGFQVEYLSLKAHPKLSVVSVVVVIIAWLMSGVIAEIGWNIALLFATLYTFVGTAILHSIFATIKIKRFIVPMLYLTLFMIPHVLAVVVIVGIVDAWLDLRSKFANNIRT